MKIFLSSTAYDLSDIRALTVDLLRKKGHEVLFHESPTFPARVGLHSHDQCVEAIVESDLVVCLIDKRYGGKYAGTRLSTFDDQTFQVLGSIRSGRRKKFPVCIKASELSIIWVELIAAHKKGIPVITFARQRILDEKETRRSNQFLSSFRPACAEKNELFDLLDWITKQKVNNWIAPFNSIVDLQDKLNTWMLELEKTIPNVDVQTDSSEPSRVCVIVEGEVDRLFVSILVQQLGLTQKFVIIPTYGKYNVLNNFQSVVAQYAKIFEFVVVILDSDAQSDQELEANVSQLERIIAADSNENIHPFFAHPSIEAWIDSGLAYDGPALNEGQLVTKEIFMKRHGKPSINHVRNLLVHKFDYQLATSRSEGFHAFVKFLMSCNGANKALKRTPLRGATEL